MSRTPRRSLFLKLASLLGMVQLAAVAGVSGWLTYSEARGHRRELEHKAVLYAQLTAEQVKSAVAFDDKETAREIFDAVAQDGDVESLALYLDSGALLHGRGEVEPAREGPRPEAPVVRADTSSLWVTAPVTSVEGPKGTLVLRLSTASVSATIAARTREGLVAATLALVLSLLAAALIAGRLSTRIGRVARAAAHVAEGQLDGAPVGDRSSDELGVLGRGFDTMVGQLRTLMREMATRAEQEQVRLEGLVAARTAALDARNQDLRRVLDTVEQGLVLIDRDGRMSAERSAIMERWLGPAPASLWTYLAQGDARTEAWLEAAWASLVEDVLPRELALAQLPQRLRHGAQTFSLSYALTDRADGSLGGALVVITDISAQLAREAAERDERETLELLRRLIDDRESTLDMLAEAAGLVASILDPRSDLTTLMRALHTLKGNAGQFGLERVAQLCHDAESRLVDVGGGLEPAELQALEASWSDVSRRVAAVVDPSSAGELRITRAEYQALLAATRDPKVLALVELWPEERVEPRLTRFAEQARQLAERLGQPPLEVQVSAQGVRAPGRALTGMWPVLTHVVRNAVDHGARPGEPGRLELSAVRDRDGLRLTVRDHGPGVPWARVRARAQALGLPHETPAELTEALFADGLSTRDEVTTTSGRGVGLSAVRAAATATGAQLELSSDEHGTTVTLRWANHLLSPTSRKSAPSPSPAVGDATRAVKGAST